MSSLGIIAEDYSDIETLKILIHRINNRKFKFRIYSAKGCGRLRRKCSKITSLWVHNNIKYIIICHDLDCDDEEKLKKLYQKLESKVSDIPKSNDVICIVIPIQELEAWFLSDASALNNKFKGMKLKDIPNPEKIPSPKEYIEKRSRSKNSKPRYINTFHNPELAETITISRILEKCRAFRPFHDFVSNLR